MPPRNLSIRQRDVQRNNLEGPQSRKALDSVPIRNSFTQDRHAGGPITPRHGPVDANKPGKPPQTLSYPELPTEAYADDTAFLEGRPSLRPSASQPQPLSDSAAASWDLEAAEEYALSQPELSSLVGGSDVDEDSCSPTPSEIDALEESYYEYELQSSQAETDFTQSSSQDAMTSTLATCLSNEASSFRNGSPIASSANYNDYSRPSSTTPTLIALPPSSAEHRETRASEAIKDRLRLVWRMFYFPNYFTL